MTTMSATLPTSIIDPSWTINETVTRLPDTLPVFDAFGLDSCCGGGHPIREAARRHGLDLEALLTALNAAVVPARSA